MGLHVDTGKLVDRDMDLLNCLKTRLAMKNNS